MWQLDHKESLAPQNCAFELWCWRRLLRVPWTARRSNKSILKEISPEYSLEGLMLKLKLQYFGHLMQRTDSLERPWFWERLKVGEGDNRGWDGWMASPTRWTWVWVSSRSSWWTGKPSMLQSIRSQRVEHDWETKLNINMDSKWPLWFSAWERPPSQNWLLNTSLKSHHVRVSPPWRENKKLKKKPWTSGRKKELKGKLKLPQVLHACRFAQSL